MGFLDLFRTEKKVSIKDLREWQDILVHREKNTSKTGDFFKQMREYDEYKKQAQLDREQEIAEIIDNYAPEESNAEALKMFGSIASRFLAHNQPKTVDIPNEQINLATQEDSTQPLGSLLSDSQVKAIAEKISKQKGLKPFVEQMKHISAEDFERIKRCL